MRILLTGAGGQVGHELARALAPLGQVDARDRAGLDLADAGALVRACRSFRPALIVNAAAYTAVDRAESDAEAARLINARAPGILAGEAKRLGAVLVHYSTDYVFDGEAREPYVEDDPVRPASAYGRSKLAGERAVAESGAAAIVLRTSWVYGRRGRNFLLTIERLADEGRELRVVDDQIGVPNWSRELARATARIVGGGLAALAARRGLYHLSGRGRTTWYGFAKAILADRAAVRIAPITTAEYPTPALRPAMSVLDPSRFERTFGFSLPEWSASLRECLTAPAAPGGDDVGR